MYNASERKDIRRAEKAAAQAEAARVEFIRAAMGTWQGRAWFHDLLAACHLFADPFTGDALREAYSKGERNVGLRLFADISAWCPDQYITMIQEANERDRNAARSRHSDSPAEFPGSEDDGWDVDRPDAGSE